MNVVTISSAGAPQETAAVELRQKPRVTHPFLATVCGVSADGVPFKTMTIVNNLSASGLHLSLRQRVETGAELLLAVHLVGQSPEDGPKPYVFFMGEVRRAEALPAGNYGYGIASRGHQLRYLNFVNSLALQKFSWRRDRPARPRAPHHRA